MRKQIWLAEALSRKERMDERKLTELAQQVNASHADAARIDSDEKAGNKAGRLENETAGELGPECRVEPEGTGCSITPDEICNVNQARRDYSGNEHSVMQV